MSDAHDLLRKLDCALSGAQHSERCLDKLAEHVSSPELRQVMLWVCGDLYKELMAARNAFNDVWDHSLPKERTGATS